LSLEVVNMLPGVDPYAEGECVVDPFFWIVFIFIFTGNGLASREAIRSLMPIGWNVYEFEVEE